MAEDVPRLALPLRLAGTKLATLEQDSNDEIAQCVETICRYRQGMRTSDPEFGIPGLTFRELPIGEAELNREIARQEPRASALVEEDKEMYADAVAVLGVTVEGGEGGG